MPCNEVKMRYITTALYSFNISRIYFTISINITVVKYLHLNYNLLCIIYYWHVGSFNIILPNTVIVGSIPIVILLLVFLLSILIIISVIYIVILFPIFHFYILYIIPSFLFYHYPSPSYSFITALSSLYYSSFLLSLICYILYPFPFLVLLILVLLLFLFAFSSLTYPCPLLL